MILIPEQVEKIKETIERLEEKIKTYKCYFDERRSFGQDDSKVYVGDIQTENEYNREVKELENYQSILKNSTKTIYIPSDEIGIGTEFILHFSDGEEMKVTFCDNLVGLNHLDGYISKDSPIGKKLFAKKAGDVIKQGDLEIKIKEITTEFQEKPKAENQVEKVQSISEKDINIGKYYSETIRNRCKGTRICKKEAKRRKEILDSKDKTAYEEITALSESQIDVLKQEQNDIVNFLKETSLSGKDRKKLIQRLSYVRKLIASSNIASLPDDNTIGIGSQFSMMIISSNFETKFERRELINSAVSIEKDDMYIERISPLGSKIYGLGESEECIFRIDSNNNHATVIVYDIDNTKDRLVTNDPTDYVLQKAKRR